jgi:osmotically-inducible protein OsmY
MSSAAAVKMIVGAAALEDYQSTAASRQALADLALTATVQAALLRSPILRDLMINVQANQGEVSLSGVLPAATSEEEIRKLVEGVPGVSKITTDFVNIPARVLRYG